MMGALGRAALGFLVSFALYADPIGCVTTRMFEVSDRVALLRNRSDVKRRSGKAALASR